MQGFLFAVAAAPDLVPPSEWLPIIFDEASAGYRNLAEAQVVMPALLGLYNTIVAGVNEHRAGLPADCRFRRAALANLDEDAPVSQWSRGFVRGYSWLEESWAVPLPEEMERDLGLILMTLGFFASRHVADAFAEETGVRDVPRLATSLRRAFAGAMAEYAEMGRTIQRALTSKTHQPSRRSAVSKVGRNDPCPCGSGIKYKKCCGVGHGQPK